MRETACLQVQVRDYTNNTASRFNILKSKPNMIQNWLAFTLAHHLVLRYLFREETFLLCSKL